MQMVEPEVIKIKIQTPEDMTAFGGLFGNQVLNPYRMRLKDEFVYSYGPSGTAKTTFLEGVEKALPRSLRKARNRHYFTIDEDHAMYPGSGSVSRLDKSPEVKTNRIKARIHPYEHSYFHRVLEHPGVMILISNHNRETGEHKFNNAVYFQWMIKCLDQAVEDLKVKDESTLNAAKIIRERLHQASLDEVTNTETRTVRVFLTTQNPRVRAAFRKTAQILENSPRPTKICENLGLTMPTPFSACVP